MPNTVYGIVYYSLHILTQIPLFFMLSNMRTLAVILGVASIVTSAWLAYVLSFILQVHSLPTLPAKLLPSLALM